MHVINLHLLNREHRRVVLLLREEERTKLLTPLRKRLMTRNGRGEGEEEANR